MIKNLAVKVVENESIGSIDILIDNVNFGAFCQLDVDGLYSYFPKRQDKLTGDHYMAIGEALNEINSNQVECVTQSFSGAAERSRIEEHDVIVINGDGVMLSTDNAKPNAVELEVGKCYEISVKEIKNI